MSIAIVVCLLLAVVAGLVANRFVRPFAKSEVQGVKLEALVSPMVTLSVLLLAFVLVQTFASFTRARDSEGDEARKIDFLYETAGYAPERQAVQLQGAVACYARVMAELEWPTTGEGRTAPEASVWTGQMRGVYGELIRQGGDQPFPILIATDKERGEARSRRLTEARPALPTAITILMIAATTLGVFALATFTLPNVQRNTQIFALAGLTTVLIVVQLAIADLDRPYSGVIQVSSTDLERVAADLGEDFGEDHPGRPLPCDEQGRPTAASGLRES